MGEIDDNTCMMNEIDPIEYDAAFGNLLNDMMIAMEKDAMIEDINFELQTLADEAKEEIVDAQYEDYLTDIGNMLQAEHDMMMYASHSYDEDAAYYGAH